jgi:hypothetical protein
LILCAGIPARWLEQRSPVSFGPAPTSFGTVSVIVTPLDSEQVRVDWQGDWHGDPPPIELRLPGHEVASVAPGVTSFTPLREGTSR